MQQTICNKCEIYSLSVGSTNKSHIFAYSFVANFVRDISAKYYLNWFSFHTVIMKVLGVNVFLKHSVYMYILYIYIYKDIQLSCGIVTGS